MFTSSKNIILRASVIPMALITALLFFAAENPKPNQSETEEEVLADITEYWSSFKGRYPSVGRSATVSVFPELNRSANSDLITSLIYYRLDGPQFEQSMTTKAAMSRVINMWQRHESQEGRFSWFQEPEDEDQSEDAADESEDESAQEEMDRLARRDGDDEGEDEEGDDDDSSNTVERRDGDSGGGGGGGGGSSDDEDDDNDESQDTRPPQISGMQTSADTSSATLSWTTDEPARSIIAFGPTENYDEEISNSSYDTTHTMSMDDLVGGQTYHYQVTAVDRAGNRTSTSDSTFVTVADETNAPPTASFSATPESGDAPLTVSFDAQTSSDPDDNIQIYSWDFGDETGTGTSNETTTHTYDTPGSYTVELRVIDAENDFDTTSQTITALDGTAPAAVTNLTANADSDDQISLSWSLSADDSDDVSQYVIYSDTSANPTDVLTAVSAGTNSFTHSDLSAETTYHYRVTAEDDNNNESGYSSGVTATTDPTPDTAAPTISNISVSRNTNSAVVSWGTDEPATSRVNYGETTSYGDTVTKENFVTSHGLTVLGLDPATTYHYELTSTDAAGNTTQSSDRTFETQPAPDTDEPFKIFDTTGFDQQPEMQNSALTPLDILYKHRFWRPDGYDENKDDVWELPERAQVEKIARQAKQRNPNRAVLDVEWMPLHGEAGQDGTERTIDRLSTIIEWFRAEEPEMEVGYYSVFPRPRHNLLTNDPPDQDFMDNWRAQNEIRKDILPHIDFFAPQRYTRGRSWAAWLITAKHVLKEIDHYNTNDEKEEYFFLWPQYYFPDYSGGGREWIGADFWRFQLEFTYEYTDGAMFYIPSSVGWDEAKNEEWWQVTQDFLAEIENGTYERKQLPPGDFMNNQVLTDENDKPYIAKDFTFFDGTAFSSEPEIQNSALEPIDVLYTAELYGKSKSEVDWEAREKPPASRIPTQAAEAKAINDEWAVLDIEHWPIDFDDDAGLQQTLDAYSQVIGDFKAETPNMNWAYYSFPPHRDYFNSLQPATSTRFQDWQAENDQLTGLAEDVDGYFPQTYAYRDNPDQWERFAEAQVAEARRYGDGKEVYQYVWPQFHPASDQPDGSYVSPEFWKRMLETAYREADGAIIYMPSGADWEEEKDKQWWSILQQFLTEIEDGQFSPSDW